MRPLHCVRRHALAVLGLVVLAFVVWVWQTAFRTDEPRIAGPQPNELSLANMPQAMTDDQIPDNVTVPLDRDKRGKPNPRETAQELPKLKPGMTRVEVEGLVGIPAPQDTHPATVSGARVTYRTSYEADLELPTTIRPFRHFRPPVHHDPKRGDRTLVTLEYDATKTGHPLLGVHYPDPLF